jgi:hypothetical protein
MNRSKRNKIIISIFLVVIASAIAMMIYFAFDWSAHKQIKDIDISGIMLLDEQEVINSVKPMVIDKKKDEIDLKAIADTLKKNQFIKDSYISFASSDRIGIEIIERVPKAYLVKDNGSLVYVDSDYKIFEYRPNRTSTDIPLIRNVLSASFFDTLALANALEMLKFIKEKDEDVFEEISEIIFDEKEKSFEIIYTGSAKKVLVGKIDDFEEKLNKLRVILDIIDQEKPLHLSKYIDIRWRGQIVARS